jgi:ATP/maltotriose-dependent transcriptional regulator MalT
VGDLVFAAYALSKLGLAATVLGDARRADELFRSAMTEADAADDAWMRTEAATQRANLAAATGDLDEAAALFAETAVAWEQIGDHSAAAHSLSNIGFAQVRLGRIAEAALPAVTSARFYARLRHPQGTLYSLVLLAAIFGRLGRPDRAHALLGAASALEAETEWALEPAEAAMRDDVAADVRLMVTPEAAASISRATDGQSPYDLVAAAADELEGAVPIGTRH